MDLEIQKDEGSKKHRTAAAAVFGTFFIALVIWVTSHVDNIQR